MTRAYDVSLPSRGDADSINSKARPVVTLMIVKAARTMRAKQ